MAEYVLGHHLEGEGKRLALMSQLLDPMHRRHIESLNIEPGACGTLEVIVAAPAAARLATLGIISPAGRALNERIHCIEETKMSFQID